MSNPFPGPAVAVSASGQQLAQGPPGRDGAQGLPGPPGPPGASVAPFLIASLRSTPLPGSHAIQFVDGFTTQGDGGGGSFVWVASGPLSVAADDNATIFQITGVLTGRWVREAALGTAIVDAAWFGGAPNAKYQKASDGSWYQDVGLTIGASDDAPKVAAAVAYAVAIGAASVYIRPGNWYFKTRTGPNREFVLLQSGVTIFGDGDASAIRIAPGFNTSSGGGGYTCVFGSYASITSFTAVNNVAVRNLLIDCNSVGNQWPHASFSWSGTPNDSYPYDLNAAVLVGAGDNVVVDSVSVINNNGVFQFACGTYGRPDLLTNYRITSCRLYHGGDDPNIGDVSWISCTGTNGVVQANRIDYGGTASVNWSSVGGAPVCAIEVHGFGTVVAHNVIRGVASAINVGADSYDAGQITIARNLVKGCTAGVAIAQLFGHAMRGLEIVGNQFIMRAPSSGAEVGISFSQFSVLSQSQGLGIYDLHIHGNEFIGLNSPTAQSVGMLLAESQAGGNTFTPPNWQAGHTYSPFSIVNTVQNSGQPGFYYVVQSITTGISGGSQPAFAGPVGSIVVDGGVTWLCAGTTTAGVVTTGGGWRIHDNKIRNFAQAGIQISVASTTDTAGGNKMYDVHIYDNDLYRVGTIGVYLIGSSYDSAAEFIDFECINNTIVDDRGGSSVLQYAIYATAWLDSTSLLRWGNRMIGWTTGDVFLDTARYPSTAPYLRTEYFADIVVEADGIGSTNAGVLNLNNATAATAGTPVQSPPSIHFSGFYWTGAASHRTESWWQLLPGSNPEMVLWISDNGGAQVNPFNVIYNVGSNITSWLGKGALVLDQSGSGLSIEERFNSTSGYWQVTDNGTVVLKASPAGGGNTQVQFATTCQVGFFGATTVGKQSDAGTVTDSTGGTASGTAAAIAAGATYAQADMVAVKNAIASLLVQTNALRNALHAYGLM